MVDNPLELIEAQMSTCVPKFAFEESKEENFVFEVLDMVYGKDNKACTPARIGTRDRCSAMYSCFFDYSSEFDYRTACQIPFKLITEQPVNDVRFALRVCDVLNQIPISIRYVVMFECSFVHFQSRSFQLESFAEASRNSSPTREC